MKKKEKRRRRWFLAFPSIEIEGRVEGQQSVLLLECERD